MVHQVLTTGLRVKLMLALVLATVAVGAPAFALTSAAKADCPYNGYHPTIQEGDTGEAVKHAQCLFNDVYSHGGRPALDEDGIFGPETDKAIRQLQADYDLVADGIIGSCTWALLHPDDYPDDDCFVPEGELGP